jgi:hypothetical protein
VIFTGTGMSDVVQEVFAGKADIGFVARSARHLQYQDA